MLPTFIGTPPANEAVNKVEKVPVLGEFNFSRMRH